MADWEPELYNRFAAYRAEPVRVILERLRIEPAERIVDLGCGSGQHTVELARRARAGFAEGIDSSPAMVERANRLRAALDPALAGRVRFTLGDIARLESDREYSLVFSNATFQWLSNHRAALELCYRALTPGGRLAAQMPANDEETAQRSLLEMARERPWREIFGNIETPSRTVSTPEYYRRVLEAIGFVEVDCYYHIFHHPMRSPAEVVEWSRATSLRPFLAALPEAEHERFLAAWRERLERAYGTTGALTFDFRRLFLWGRRP